METKMSRSYLIVGLGAAGIRAAETIRSHDPGGDILLVSDDRHGYYSRPGLAYYLTGEIPEKMLFPFGKEEFERLNLRRRQALVTRLDTAAHRVQLNNGESLPYDRLLLATGSLAVIPPLQGSELDGVLKLDDLDDAQRILEHRRRTRSTAIVIGGGITALELVEGLRANRLQTHYFLRSDRYWSNVLDETESRIVAHRLQEEGVHLHFETEVAVIEGKRGRVTGVRTRDGRHFKCNLVAIAIGVRPRLDLVPGSGLEADRGILVDEHLHTSAADVFAAGDVAQVYDPLSDRAILDTLWSAALAQGQAAGLNMAGHPTAYRKAVPFNVTRLAGLTTTIIGTVGRGKDQDLSGIGRGDSESWRQLPDSIAAQSDFDVNRLRVMVGDRTLLGAVIMGDQTLSQPLHHLIAHQADITPIRESLLKSSSNLAPHTVGLIADFWSNWRKSHAAPRS
jgi:nitrite reductase (NADH) large subunit